MYFFSVKAPTGLQAPIQLTALPGGKTVTVTWASPERPNGVISEYRILSYRVHPPQSAPGETVIKDTGVLNATISGLQPYTTYEIRIQASTVGGSSVGPGKNVTTEESGIFQYLLNLFLVCVVKGFVLMLILFLVKKYFRSKRARKRILQISKLSSQDDTFVAYGVITTIRQVASA